MNDHPRLGAEKLRLAYGPRVIVPGLDLDVPPAAFTVLLGPNGSGKSTVLRALAGLLRPVAGRVVLDGRPLPQFSPRRLARRIGLLPQAPLAPEGTTVEALVGLGRHPHRGFLAPWSAADAAACARAMATTRTADLAGRGLDTLSGGQRQRAWIAMALAQETPILLLDEPTTFLDLAHQIEILSLLRDLVRAGRTVVAVLHDLQLAARYADHLVLLAAGRIAARGTPKAVLTAAQVEAVFGLRVRVIPDPETGRPLCLPRSDQGLRRA